MFGFLSVSRLIMVLFKLGYSWVVVGLAEEHAGRLGPSITLLVDLPKKGRFSGHLDDDVARN